MYAQNDDLGQTKTRQSEIATLLAYSQVAAKEISACYGTNIACDFYSLECEETERIKLNTFKYGYKRGKECHKGNQACKEDGGCCRYEKSDCTNNLHAETTFDIYTNCSGKSTCGPFQAPWVGMSYCGPMSEVITSDYLTIDYDCVDKNESLDICDTRKLLTDRVYLIFDGAKKYGANFNPERACSCSFTGVGIEGVTSLAVTIIDVRFAKSSSSLSDCSSTRLKIQDRSFARKCTLGSPISNFYKNLNLDYVLKDDSLDISLEAINSSNTTDHPALIWLQVKGNSTFHLSCNTYQSNTEQRTILPTESLDEVRVTSNIFTPSPNLNESGTLSTGINSKSMDEFYDVSFYKNASPLKIREPVANHVDEHGNSTGEIEKTESPTTLYPKTKYQIEIGGHIITTIATSKVTEDLGANDSALHQKGTNGLDNDFHNGQLIVNILIPVLTGVLMTFVVIISVYVKCRTRKRTGRYKTDATEGTYLDEESETENPNGALAQSSKPEASRDSDMESTKL